MPLSWQIAGPRNIITLELYRTEIKRAPKELESVKEGLILYIAEGNLSSTQPL